ncbi:Threonine/homoserine/homoserine lactone efflux protein [Mesobacillus persicus]|uniref:Threonine/homoserine/homoserine lactone efflux protein n=1 Tax=Mesobacillus persicus TaxID=930146 RepID=A0A1H8HSH7_9BACI|nr:LysE family transporter [Mesobacillus persicus]SEN59240.1 Threonine/homoserine/homoserine lactone efflux protein [Mesobacillus persicus]
MSVFLSYVFLGLSLAAPIGPVNAAQMDKGIKSGFFHSWLLGLGALSADIIYMLSVYMGVVRFLETPFMQTFLWFFGFFVLMYTGIETIVGAGKVVLSKHRQPESGLKSFMSGFLMSISNPLTILFWLGIYGSVLARTASSFGTAELILYSFAIILGLIIWDITMAFISSSFKKLLTTRILSVISVFSGLSLIGFAIYFGIQAVKVLLNS